MKNLFEVVVAGILGMAVLALFISILYTAGRTVIDISQSDLHSAVVVECVARNSRRASSVSGRHYRTSYAPVALTSTGDKTAGRLAFPRRDWCERLIGTSVPVFVHEDVSKKNRLGSFLQLWLFPYIIATGVILFVARKHPWTTRAVLGAACLIGTLSVCYEFGAFGVNRPETNLTSDTGQFDACVNGAIVDQGIRSREELKRLSCNPIPNIELLSDFTALEELSIISENFDSLTLLPDFKNLRLLAVRNARLESLDGLERYKQLTALHLMGVQFPTIEDIPAMPNLQDLRIRSNQSLFNLAGIERFSTLEQIELERNQVSDISPLAGLTKLKRVELFYEPVTDLSPLITLNALETARFRSLNTHDFSPLHGKPNIRHAGATGTDIPCEAIAQWMATVKPSRKKFMWVPKHCRHLKANI